MSDIETIESEWQIGLYAMPGHLIRRSQQIATALFSEELADLDLTSVQFAVLMAVVHNPQIEAARISDLIAFDRSTLADVLDRLAGRGLVERQVSLADRRVKTIVATAKGQALFERAVPAVFRVQERILAPLPEQDRGGFIRMLRSLVGLHTGDERYDP